MKTSVILSMLLIVGILFGCTEQQTGVVPKSQPFIGGTTGIVVDFAGDSPPAEVDDGGDFPFDIVVELRNVGEHTVKKDDMEVRILGVRPEDFDKSEEDLTQHPEENVIATRKDPEGDINEAPPVYVTFSDFNHRKPLVGNKDFTFRAEVCYLYETTATAQLCIRKNNIDPEEGGVCEISEHKAVYNSGAPVTVTEFKEFGRARSKVGFEFKIQHMSNGNIHEKNSNCNQERKFEDRVWVEVDTTFDGGLKCSGLNDGDDTSGFVKMYGENRIVSCTQEVDTDSDYETSVDITLTYDYRDDTETTVLVKHIPEDEEDD
jgi:hypothetical protein